MKRHSQLLMRMGMRTGQSVFFAIIATTLSAAAFSQTSPAPEQSITGRAVLDDGQPAAGASIAAYPLGVRGRLYTASCDEAGYFKLSELVPGSYSLGAEAPGFVLEGRPLGDNVYRAGENVTLRLVRGGVITGRVTDVAGEPLVGVGINLYRVRDEEGNRPRQGMPWHGDVQTDDRGIYRAFGLEPGAYIVGVEVDSGGGYGGRDVPTWYPATTRAAATEVIVHAGEEVTNIDIRHRGVAGYTISGTMSGETETSSPFGGVGVTLFDTATKAPVAQGSVHGDSKSFVVAGLYDGEYEIFAQMYVQEGEMAGSLPRHVTIKGADVTGIDLKLARFGSLAGRVAIERPALTTGSNTPAKCESKNHVEEILIRARSEGRNPRLINTLMAENGWRVSRIAPDAKGEFTIKALEADGYRLEANLPSENWYIRSITQHSSQQASQPASQSAGSTAKRSDAARTPINLKPGERLTGIEIAIAEGAASLNGHIVANKEGQKLPPHLQVYLVPAEVTAADDVLRYAETLADKNSAFAFQHLAPGKYWLLAQVITETETSKDGQRQAAFDPMERAKLHREAEAAKNEITLQPCQRAKDVTARFAMEK